MRVLFDTNVVIEHLHGVAHTTPFFDAIRDGRITLLVSVITEYEVLRFPRITPEEEDAAIIVLDRARILDVGRRTAQVAALLARAHPSLETPDALIAATAIEHGVPLCTRNVRDFRRIAELQLLTEPPNDGDAPQPHVL